MCPPENLGASGAEKVAVNCHLLEVIVFDFLKISFLAKVQEIKLYKMYLHNIWFLKQQRKLYNLMTLRLCFLE